MTKDLAPLALLSPISALTAACLLLLAGALFSIVFKRHHRTSALVGHLGSAGACLLGGYAGIAGMTYPGGAQALFGTSLFGEVGIRLDGLSAFFVLVISIVGFAVSIYAPRYVDHFAHGRSPSGLTTFFNLFILSLYLVVTVDNAFGFILAWEMMSLISYFFVVFDHKEAQNAQAGYLYLVMTHLSTAFIMVSFLVLGSATGSIIFKDMAVAAPLLSPEVATLVFALALVGFGIKAGIVPLHLWLPEAHPAAPSHISALMSGVMIKTAIYGLIRVVFDILGPPELGWGIILLAIGAISATLGVMYALMEHDLKRLLAFHSVENIGIILLGIGAAAIYLPSGMYAAAALALTAGLLHTLNHALFKTLLFLGAGAVQFSTGTRDIEKLGGLARIMPYTAGLFFLGSAAIAAMPPLNGFLSEWLTLQSLLLGTAAPDLISKLVVPAAAAALAITGGFAAACFVKAYGIIFLGRARSDIAVSAREVPRSMLAGMGVLALLCIVIGLSPATGTELAQQTAAPIVADIAGDSEAGVLASETELLKTGITSLALTTRPSSARVTEISPVYIALMVLGTAFLVLALARRRSRRLYGTMKERVAAPWACGMPALTPRMQYSATAFTKPLRLIFKGIYFPQREIKINCSDADEPYAVQGVHYHSSLLPVYELYLYRPLGRGLLFLGKLAARLETGNIQSYLLYIFTVLVVILVVAQWT